MLSTFFIFIVILVGLILTHELGHFITAKASGVKVIEFGVGFPPRIFGRQRGETMYSLNAVPLGGFTKMAGEEDPDTPRSLAGKPVGIRLLVLAGGSLMNFLLPLILLAIAFMVPHNVVEGEVFITEVAPNSPAEAAGILPGDRIDVINGHVVESTADLQRYVQLNLGDTTEVKLTRSDGTTATVSLIPRWRPPSGEGAMGVAVNMENYEIIRRSEPAWKAVPLAVTSYRETFGLFKNGILSMLAGTAPLEVRGPVGIAEMTGEVAAAGISPLLEFAAFLSINLGLLNIFPLPALDGGRIAFVILEKIRGKRVSPQTEGKVHLIGFVLLIGILIAITYNDIARIVGG